MKNGKKLVLILKIQIHGSDTPPQINKCYNTSWLQYWKNKQFILFTESRASSRLRGNLRRSSGVTCLNSKTPIGDIYFSGWKPKIASAEV